MTFSFDIASELSAAPGEVLGHAATIAGANRELGPLLRMTTPRAFRDLTLFDAPVGPRLFRSWVLLGGFLPIDYDHLAFEEIDPESGFVESSTMLTMTMWRHERRVVATSTGARIVDRLTFTPRIPGTGALLARVVRMVFRHRHSRLRAIFGECVA